MVIFARTTDINGIVNPWNNIKNIPRVRKSEPQKTVDTAGNLLP